MRKASEFAQIKASYLAAKKQQAYSATTSKREASSRGLKVQSARTSTKQRPKTTAHNECNIEALPDELLQKIFFFLDVKSVLSCASTCGRWGRIANDNVIWKRLYCVHLHPKPKGSSENYVAEPESPLVVTEKYWKRRFFRRCRELRNKRFQALDKINPYTGITRHADEIIEKVGVKFQLCLVTATGTFVYMERKRAHFQTSSLISWYSLRPWPKTAEVSKIKVFALVPLVYGKDKKTIRSSPRQKSMVFSEDVRKLDKCVVVHQNEEIKCHQTLCGVLFALWKESDDFAFFSLALHHKMLLRKCLFSTASQTYSIPHCIKADDVDKLYGLHGYKCHILLQGSDNVAMNEVVNLDDASRFCAAGIVNFTLDRKTFSLNDFRSTSAFDWKTDVFGGKIFGLTFLAVTLRDMNADVIWSLAVPVALKSASVSEVDFMASGEPLRVCYEDDTGKISMTFKPENSSDYFIDGITIGVRMTVINSWFGTSHR